MKSINFRFKIVSPAKATVKATALMNAVNLSILIHNEPGQPDIDRSKLRSVVREMVNNPVNGLVNRFITDLHITPKFTKANVTVLLSNAETKKVIKQRIKETARWIVNNLFLKED